VLRSYHDANNHLEAGILAEFDKQLKPEEFREALVGYEATLESLNKLDKQLDRLMEVNASGVPDKKFLRALNKLLKQAGPFERLSTAGRRYSTAGGLKGIKAETPDGITGILKIQKNDIQILKKVLGETIESLRAAIPLAEKGEFVPVMLSGRAGFGEKMPQFTDLISGFDRGYIQRCMVTIAATMQVYPSGFGWLRGGPQ